MIVDRGDAQAIVAPPPFAVGKRARLAHVGDDAAGRQRDGILVEWLAVLHPDPGGAKRERSAEGAAQIVALGQLARVGREQLARARQQGHLRLVDPSHRANLHGFGAGRGVSSRVLREPYSRSES